MLVLHVRHLWAQTMPALEQQSLLLQPQVLAPPALKQQSLSRQP